MNVEKNIITVGFCCKTENPSLKIRTFYYPLETDSFTLILI